MNSDHTLTPLEEQFVTVASIHNGVYLLAANDALRYVEECHRAGVDIFGVEGFKKFGEKIQPLQEYSLVLDDSLNNYAVVEKFLHQYLHSDLWFEIVTSEWQ
ncbi:MAG: hypothetical protein ACFCD0_01095 [Gemmataceae bacterium]